MKNRYTIILFYLCAIMICFICIIQIYNLSNAVITTNYSLQSKLYHQFRFSQGITLILSIILIAILFSKEGGNRKAYTDITGMMNTHACLEDLDHLAKLLNQMLCDISNQHSRLAVVRSDINNFRYINEFFGHKEGDNILETFTVDLCKQSFCLYCCRVYSDNFAFLADLSQLSQEEGAQLIRTWNIGFSAHMNQTYKASRLIVKSGIYYISDVNESLDSMLDKADCARKNTKNSLQNVLIYTDELCQAERKRSKIINSFQNALDNLELKVYVQPKVMISDKSICGAESLVRWQRKNGDFFYPDDFIPILEQTGDVIDMDFYVYETVFSFLYLHSLSNEPLIPISVNVSRVHLANVSGFLKRIRSLHNRYPIPPKFITFELTESAYIQELDSAAIFIDGLHQLGYQVSLDDFGSGYSSLKALQSMPFDEIKFDRAFLLDTAHEKENRIFLEIIKLVKNLDLSIVCEGVETAENVNLLEQSDCDIMQGYYYYKPFPLENLTLSFPKTP